jgi:Na+-driven multidrug efflux pump
MFLGCSLAPGAGDVGYLARIHVVNFVVLAGYVYMAVHLNLGIRGIWFAIVLNQLMRLTEHAFRVTSGKTRWRNKLG